MLADARLMVPVLAVNIIQWEETVNDAYRGTRVSRDMARQVTVR